MFPAYIYNNQSEKTLHAPTWSHGGIIHTDTYDTVTPICPFSLLPLPPSSLSTKQMEVSVDFHLNTRRGGATGLICMFRSEELSVRVTEVPPLTQLHGLSAPREVKGRWAVTGAESSVPPFYYCNLWTHLLSLRFSSKAKNKNKTLFF